MFYQRLNPTIKTFQLKQYGTKTKDQRNRMEIQEIDLSNHGKLTYAKGDVSTSGEKKRKFHHQKAEKSAEVISDYFT